MFASQVATPSFFLNYFDVFRPKLPTWATEVDSLGSKTDSECVNILGRVIAPSIRVARHPGITVTSGTLLGGVTTGRFLHCPNRFR